MLTAPQHDRLLVRHDEMRRRCRSEQCDERRAHEAREMHRPRVVRDDSARRSEQRERLRQCQLPDAIVHRKVVEIRANPCVVTVADERHGAAARNELARECDVRFNRPAPERAFAEYVLRAARYDRDVGLVARSHADPRPRERPVTGDRSNVLCLVE